MCILVPKHVLHSAPCTYIGKSLLTISKSIGTGSHMRAILRDKLLIVCIGSHVTFFCARFINREDV